jgi:hypothetical protein
MGRLTTFCSFLIKVLSAVLCAAFLFNDVAVKSAEIDETSVALLGLRLKHAETTDVRFDALMAIREHAKSPKMPSLLKQVADNCNDTDVGVRCAAVLALAQISYEHATSCPRELIAALIDSDSEIRRAAYENIIPDRYSTLPDNVLEIAQLIVDEEKYRDVRAKGPTLLQYYSKDKKSESKLLIKAISDRDFFVRNNAAAAMLARGTSLDLAIEFYCQSVFEDINREFYSTKLGWDKIEDAEELAVFQKFQYKKLKDDVTKKYPIELLQELTKRLTKKDRVIVKSALEEMKQELKTTKSSALEDVAKLEHLNTLKVFSRHSNPQVSELAQAAIDHLRHLVAESH